MVKNAMLIELPCVRALSVPNPLLQGHIYKRNNHKKDAQKSKQERPSKIIRAANLNGSQHLGKLNSWLGSVIVVPCILQKYCDNSFILRS